MAVASFNSAVAARTRAAAQILGTPGLLSLYEELGGLKRDLEAIVKAGNDAEAANLGQSRSKAAGAAITLDVLANFASLQKEYGAVMAVVGAVRAGLAAKGALAETIAKTESKTRQDSHIPIFYKYLPVLEARTTVRASCVWCMGRRSHDPGCPGYERGCPGTWHGWSEYLAWGT